MKNETDDQIRLRRAKEAIDSLRDKENELRKALAMAVDATKRARERYEELFDAAEKREVARKMAQYNHCTA